MRRTNLIYLAIILGILAFPRDGAAQRFGGQFGGAGGIWALYVAPDVEDEFSFDRDLGGLILIGGRGFLQVGRIRLGGGGFGGSFTDEGLNPAGNDVTGGLGGGGFTAEYLLVQRDYEVAVGGLIGGGSYTFEERLSLDGDVETLNRRQRSIFIGMPWARAGYNLAPLVNAGLQIGYLIGSEDVGGFSIGLDIVVGLIP